jgi:hypothetical protein
MAEKESDMPNWCSNRVSIEHDDHRMIRRVALAFKNHNLLNEFIPIPDELKEGADPLAELTNPAFTDIERGRRIRYGYADWYDFAVAEWGTKWDVGGDDSCITVSEDEHNAYLYFDSAWSPPVAAYEKLETLGFKIYALYYEPGEGFAGIWENGSDEYYDIPASSKECLEQLPEELNSEFAIPEYMAEIEDQEEE